MCIVTSTSAELARIPDRCLGFPVVGEVETVVAAGSLLDRVRRATGRRPLRAWAGWPGCAVRADGLRKAGTLGCYARCLVTGRIVATTCEHVLTDSSAPPPVGQTVEVYVAGDAHSDTVFGRIAAVERVVGTGEDPLDVAFVQPGNPRRAVNTIPRIGALSREPANLDVVPLGARVCKFGATSGLTVGVITAVQDLEPTRSDGVAVKLRGVMEITPDFDRDFRCASFCSRGDSGSIVTLRTSASVDVPAIGHLVARGTLLQRGYVLGLDRVLSAYNLRLI